MTRLPFSKVAAGDRIVHSATEHNAMIDAALAARRYNAAQAARLGPKSADFILVKNGTGGDRVAGELVGLHTPVVSPDESQEEFLRAPVMIAGSPYSLMSCAVVIEDIPNGKFGRVAVAGCWMAWLEDPPQEPFAGKTFAGPGHQESEHPYRFHQAKSGWPVLWQSSEDPPNRWAIVRLGTPYTQPTTIEFFAEIFSTPEEIGPKRWRYPVKILTAVQPDEPEGYPVLGYQHPPLPGFGADGYAYNTAEDPSWGDDDRPAEPVPVRTVVRVCVTPNDAPPPGGCPEDEPLPAEHDDPPLSWWFEYKQESAAEETLRIVDQLSVEGATVRAHWKEWKIRATATENEDEDVGTLQPNADLEVIVGASLNDGTLTLSKKTLHFFGNSEDAQPLELDLIDAEEDVIVSATLGADGIITLDRKTLGVLKVTPKTAATLDLLANKYEKELANCPIYREGDFLCIGSTTLILPQWIANRPADECCARVEDCQSDCTCDGVCDADCLCDTVCDGCDPGAECPCDVNCENNCPCDVNCENNCPCDALIDNPPCCDIPADPPPCCDVPADPPPCGDCPANNPCPCEIACEPGVELP